MYWFLAGLFFLGLELLSPGFFLIWIGLSSLCVSLSSYFFQLTLFQEVVVFVVSVPVFLAMGKLISRTEIRQAEALNQRGKNLVGQSFHLTSPIAYGKGILNIDDTIWKIQGPDLETGALVKIVDIRDNALIVDQELKPKE